MTFIYLLNFFRETQFQEKFPLFFSHVKINFTNKNPIFFMKICFARK